MSTYTRIIYQVVFATKRRRPTLIRRNRPQFYAYVAGILREQGCTVFAINGVADHVHLVFSLHPSVALARLIKDIKVASSAFIKRHRLFPDFDYWGIGYGAFTYTREALPNLVRYVDNQELHHGEVTSREELRALLHAHDIPYQEAYLP